MQQKSENTIILARTIGNVLKELRKSRGLSINNFAHEFDLDVGNTSRIEKGSIEVKLVTLWRIAEALSMPLSELIGLVENKLDKNFRLYDI